MHQINILLLAMGLILSYGVWVVWAASHAASEGAAARIAELKWQADILREYKPTIKLGNKGKGNE